MITIENFSAVLMCLGFTKDGNIYRRHFDAADCDVSVDFNAQKISYPEDKGFCVNDGTTSNFSHPENFVVCECVCRLLEKGYRAEHIELEPRWSLGHGGKSGKADICVKNKDGSPYLCIIECKTADGEYKKELSNMLNEDEKHSDGGQLFSYWQQERATKWLCLYASDFNGEKLTHTYSYINCSDDSNVVELAKDDSTILLYKNAGNAKELFAAWKDTYKKAIIDTTDIIFDDETVAYTIGMLPLKKKRLVDFSRDDKIVNQFEEILRHNNVSDKENAFNRLIALFIAKLYDEKKKGEEDVVEFQYKAGTDTYQKMQDRLQNLHHLGMKEFMKEEVFYVRDDYVKKVVFDSLQENREKLEAELNDTITKLKFYTNNDFAFKDVHNKTLFYQNGKILVEMVELFQKYRIIDSKELQLLGDMFEQLLNKGFKQNEGQFFTPIPITSFIWKCLPLESFFCNTSKNNSQQGKSAVYYPRIIDYACGAGHFLTEGFREINETVSRLGLEGQKGWEANCIYGIEKDYRLARVSKISLFMHGADNGNIVFGDGLDNHDKDGIVIQNNQFDILVANPPYSVSAFKNHLDLKNNALSLLSYISDDGKEIETLFVERAAQLLKPQGIAAVILPSSILSNSSTSYIKAREEILKNFAIKSIVQFSSKTFGATGTNTVVLFMQKNSEPPVKSEIVKDNVSAIFANETLSVASDKEILKNYCQKIGVSEEEYTQFAKDAKTMADYRAYKENAYFGMYVSDFEKSTAYKTAAKQDEKAEAKDEKTHKENRIKAFYEYALGIEKEKLYYFALVYKQTTFVVSAPNADKEQEAFLGYTWSNRKGDEGIKIKSTNQSEYCGLLYNTQDREHSIAHSVKDAFSGIYRDSTYCTANALKDMIDFSRSTFDKAIKCNVQKKAVQIQSKFSQRTIQEITSIIETGSRPSGGAISSGVLSLGGEHIDNTSGFLNLTEPKFVSEEYFESAGRGKIKKYDFLICKDGALTGKVALVRDELDNKKAMVNEHVFIVRCTNIETQKYLFHFFCSLGQSLLKANITGAAQGGLNSSNFKSIKIPLPPLDVQKSIVAECEQVDAEYQEAQKEIAAARAEIARIMASVQGEEKRLGEIYKISSGGTPSRKENKYWEDGTIPWLTTTEVTNELITKTNECITEEGLKNSSAKLYPKGSLVIAMYGQGTTRGRTAKLGIETTTNQACAVLYEKIIDFDTDYVWAYLKSQYENLRSISHGSAQPNLTAGDISNFAIVLPPLAEQKRIVGLVEAEEQKIAATKQIMAECPERKRAVLQKWL